MTRLKGNSWTRCCIERRNCKLLATTVDRCKLLATLIPTSAKQIIPQQVGRYFQQFVPRSLSNHVLLFIFSFCRSFSILSKDSDWIYSSRDYIVLRAQCKRDGLFGSVLIICFVSAFVRREDRDERSEFCKFK